MSLRKSTMSRLIPSKFVTHDYGCYVQRAKARKPSVYLNPVDLSEIKNEKDNYKKQPLIYKTLMAATSDEQCKNLSSGIPKRVAYLWE